VWSHNGREIQASNSDTYRIASIAHSDSGEYRCKAKRGEVPFNTEESDAYSLQVSGKHLYILHHLPGYIMSYISTTPSPVKSPFNASIHFVTDSRFNIKSRQNNE